MKTAIILFGDNHNEPESFLPVCAEKVSSDGYVLLHTSVWRDYKHIDKREFLRMISPVVDAIYLFIDFGVSDLMKEVVESNYYKNHTGSHFFKELRIEIGIDLRSKTINSILKEVAEVTEIPIEVLKMKTRKREIVEARQFYFKRAKMFTKRSLASIGALVGKDHATVLHGIKTVNNIIEVKEKYEELFEGKKRVLKNKIVIPSEISVETKGLLIGKGPEVVRMTSPFTSIQSEVVRPYSGYRVHSM